MAILRRKEVLAATGLCYTSIYNMEKIGTFPARRKLGVRAVCWIKEEVDAWIEGLGLASVKVEA
jgi:prophage regulatory protein